MFPLEDVSFEVCNTVAAADQIISSPEMSQYDTEWFLFSAGMRSNVQAGEEQLFHVGCTW